MIDRATVERIKAAANIVEVVAEFVTLRRAGANYKGLCPFHNERTPSFIVSPARGTCHCFGCGRGGNSVSFIMEHEQMTYPEALRWLANKYHIEVKEKELTDQERAEQSEREAMLIVNEWAKNYFCHILHDHPDGQAIGMQYFRSRGIRDDIITKYQLGFALRQRYALSTQAKKEGYKDVFLVKTGLCYQNDNGTLVDRFADRVIFPWLSISGKVVGFSARCLDSRTKGVQQKYVNSPDSDIYHKDRELFGLFQAKKVIAKEDRVYIVEGQTDVFAMAQCGIENVVANSGTALSTHQIALLHRLTNNVTLLYDGDAAGIHAAMRGTDMLLSEGINVHILLLPDGDDPDSFARKHTAEEFKEYIESHQLDFIEFKTQYLLPQANDPQQRSEAIDSIVSSIACVTNPILRDTYLSRAAHATGMKEATLIARMNTFIKEKKTGATTMTSASITAATPPAPPVAVALTKREMNERTLIQYVVQNGEQVVMTDVADENGNVSDITVAQYVALNLEADNIQLANGTYSTILSLLANSSYSSAEQFLVNYDDIAIAQEAISLVNNRYTTTQHKEESVAEDEYSQTNADNKYLNATNHILSDYRLSIVQERLNNCLQRISNPLPTDNRQALLQEYQQLLKFRNTLAKEVGLKIT